MHNETLEKLTNAAKNKINMLNNSKLKYLVSSAFAGLYVGLGIILIFTVGGLLSAVDSPMTKIMMGAPGRAPRWKRTGDPGNGTRYTKA